MEKKIYTYQQDFEYLNMASSDVELLKQLMTGCNGIEEQTMPIQNLNNVATNSIVLTQGKLGAVEKCVAEYGLADVFEDLYAFFGVADADTNKAITASTTKVVFNDCVLHGYPLSLDNYYTVLDKSLQSYPYYTLINSCLGYNNAIAITSATNISIKNFNGEAILIFDGGQISSGMMAQIAIPDGYDSVRDYVRSKRNDHKPVLLKYTYVADQLQPLIEIVEPGYVLNLEKQFVVPIDNTEDINFYDLHGNKIDSLTNYKIVPNANDDADSVGMLRTLTINNQKYNLPNTSTASNIILTQGELGAAEQFVQSNNLTDVFQQLYDTFGVADADTGAAVTASTIKVLFKDQTIPEEPPRALFGYLTALETKLNDYPDYAVVDTCFGYLLDTFAILSKTNILGEEWNSGQMNGEAIMIDFRGSIISSAVGVAIPNGYNSIDDYIASKEANNKPILLKYTYIAGQEPSIEIVEPGYILNLEKQFVMPVDNTEDINFYDLHGNKIDSLTNYKEGKGVEVESNHRYYGDNPPFPYTNFDSECDGYRITFYGDQPGNATPLLASDLSKIYFIKVYAQEDGPSTIKSCGSALLTKVNTSSKGHALYRYEYYVYDGDSAVTEESLSSNITSHVGYVNFSLRFTYDERE